MWRVIKIMSIVWVCTVVGDARADDLTGAERLLCAAVQATACVDDGECGIDLPWNLNIPDFIEVDLGIRRLSTTAASGENRVTPIQHLSREGGVIVLHGYEMGRAFSWVIVEESGRATVAMAGAGISVAVFGSCTPVTEFGRSGNQEEEKP
jgi:hypothetical protein